MKIAVMGSGGLGGFFGAKLAGGGEDVTFIARGEHLRAIQSAGLRVKSAEDGEFVVKSPATDDPKAVGPVDLVLFCVKSYDTDEAAEAIRAMVSDGTVVLSLQNGVESEEKLARSVGSRHVLGGAAYIFASIEAPGVITQAPPGRIVFGELDGRETPRAQNLFHAFQRAGISAELSTNIRRVIWEKYLFITALSGVTALTRCPVGIVRSLPETRTMLKLLLDELSTLAEASGVRLSEGAVDTAMSFVERLKATSTSSLHHDLTHGKRLELEALQGYAVRLGRQLSIPTPTLFAVYGALKPYEDGRPKQA